MTPGVAKTQARYKFLRDGCHFLACWGPDSRYRVYTAGEPQCEMFPGQVAGFDRPNAAIDAAIETEKKMN